MKRKKKKVLFRIHNSTIIAYSTNNCKNSTKNLIRLFALLIKFCAIKIIFEDQKLTQLKNKKENNKKFKLKIEIAKLKLFEKKKKEKKRKKNKKNKKNSKSILSTLIKSKRT